MSKRVYEHYIQTNDFSGEITVGFLKLLLNEWKAEDGDIIRITPTYDNDKLYNSIDIVRFEEESDDDYQQRINDIEERKRKFKQYKKLLYEKLKEELDGEESNTTY